MEAIFMSLASAFPSLFEPANIAALLLGVLGGTLMGVLPGLTPTMGVAIMVPFTFGMSAKAGLILLGGLYCSSVFSGAITAILVNIPGSPANVATVFDGYPMAQAGKGKQAIYYATSASMVGGIFGMMVLLFFAPPLAQLSLLFGPAEVFWVAMFGVSIIASLSVGSMLKGLISGALGLCLSLIGMDSVTGAFRFTFGLHPLLAGIPIVAGLIGIFALSQLLNRFEDCFRNPESLISIVKTEEDSLWDTLMRTLRRTKALAIGSMVGTIVGIIPGAGGQVAALSAYNEAKRWASDAERATFGKGNPDGIIAAESANNAMCGGSLVPLFTLGIPGSPTAAVLLGGLLIHGLYPGHRLYTEHSDIVYTFLLAMLVAQVAMFITGVGLAPYLARVAKVPQNYLGPSILVLCVIGSFATQNSMGDVYIMGVLGVLTYMAIKIGFSPAALVLGHILGGIAENGLLLGARIAKAKGGLLAYFFTQPICIVLIAITAGSILIAAWLERRQNAAATALAGERPPLFRAPASLAELNMRQCNGIAASAVMALAVALFTGAGMLDSEAALFPQTLAVALAILALCLFAATVAGKGSPLETKTPFAAFPGRQMLMSVTVFVLYVLLAGWLGFYSSTFLFMLALPALLLNPEQRKTRAPWVLLIAALFTGVLYLIFAALLMVPTPRGLFL